MQYILNRLIILSENMYYSICQDVIEHTTFQAGGELHKGTNNKSFGNGVSLTLRLNHATSQSQPMDVASLSESKDIISQVGTEDIISHPKGMQNEMLLSLILSLRFERWY